MTREFMNITYFYHGIMIVLINIEDRAFLCLSSSSSEFRPPSLHVKCSLYRPAGQNEKVMTTINAREAAPAGSHQDMFVNRTELATKGLFCSPKSL